jgi:hypothetical protein
MSSLHSFCGNYQLGKLLPGRFCLQILRAISVYNVKGRTRLQTLRPVMYYAEIGPNTGSVLGKRYRQIGNLPPTTRKPFFPASSHPTLPNPARQDTSRTVFVG